MGATEGGIVTQRQLAEAQLEMQERTFSLVTEVRKDVAALAADVAGIKAVNADHSSDSSREVGRKANRLMVVGLVTSNLFAVVAVVSSFVVR